MQLALLHQFIALTLPTCLPPSLVHPTYLPPPPLTRSPYLPASPPSLVHPTYLPPPPHSFTLPTCLPPLTRSPYLPASPPHSQTYDLGELAALVGVPGGLIIGAGAGSSKVAGVNCEVKSQHTIRHTLPGLCICRNLTCLLSVPSDDAQCTCSS